MFPFRMHVWIFSRSFFDKLDCKLDSDLIAGNKNFKENNPQNSESRSVKMH